MKYFFHSRSFWVVGAVVLISIALLGVMKTVFKDDAPTITASVTRGNVESIISVSGVVESKNAAGLAFPVSDIVASVLVDEGDHVEAGDVLATLALGTLRADRTDAAAALTIARADRDELIEGPTGEAREVSESNVAIAAENLERTIIEQDELVKNARRSLFSSGVEAVPDNPNERAVPPTISGTYTCEEPVTYEMYVYSSGAVSGYSYQLSWDDGHITRTAYVDNAEPLANCGLLVQFDESSQYGNSEWTIAVPNPRSTSYAANVNAYELALTTRTNKVAAAGQALELAQSEATLENASPRAEALQRANAAVLQAEARLAAIDARIEERTLRAPFSGTITDVDVLPGEVSGTGKVVTLVSDDVFELTVRIPEIDITQIEVGDTAFVVFDARTSEILESQVEFISPLATEIDGVAYYEARLAFGEPPAWLRSGLNADVDIIVDQKEDVLRIPRRFVIEEDGEQFVYIYENGALIKTSVETGFLGNDGYIEVIGLAENATVTVPLSEPEE